MHLKMTLVDAAPKGHVVVIGDCSGALYQAPQNPDEQRAKCGSSRLQKQSWDLTTYEKLCQQDTRVD